MTKVDIFSGFLGAGKTTLIKKLIAEAYAGEKLVLIENEFGDIAIDGGFMQDAGIEVTEMNSGCICCSLVGDFEIALGKVVSEFAPDRILIEPSGVGKLSDIIRAVAAVEGLTVNSATTVVDALKCKKYAKNFGEFYDDQVKNARAVILSRTSGMAQDALDFALELLRERNSEAVIVTTPWDELDGKAILAAMEGADTLEHELHELEHEHHHHHHEHDEHCTCGCHDHDHEHHHHDDECHHEHEHHHHHEHDEHCTCGCHDHDHEHHHHHDDECHHEHEHERHHH
ncbi:MAG: cobalamin biosynthesis protein CobW, partial [Oscillospiraceae bacterium]|nr:cobalamin biosynthesis protein CobW [Oscillospiraceae bacterium]